MKVSDKTEIGLPLKNLLGLLAAVSTAVWAYFGIIERLNTIETNGKLMIVDVEKNTEFRIKWPRGEMGSLPADSEQFLLIEDTIVDVKFSGVSWKSNEGFYYSSYDKPKGSELSDKTNQHKLYYQ